MAVERPRAAPISLLVLFTSILLAQSTVLSQMGFPLAAKDVPLLLAPVVALLGIIIILNMPLRNPYLPNEDISPAFSAPTAKLRTPEDNLTPWQFMSVSWMAPLIKKGTERNIEDEVVWDLGYEFKHARLHAAFRELPGSVTRRIFVANGMDLIRTTVLALIGLVASKFVPCQLRSIYSLT